MIVSLPQTDVKSRVLESESKIYSKERVKEIDLVFSPISFPLIL